MHISKETLLVLKNFRDLNSNILIGAGNVLKTLTPAKNVMATAVVEEDFPVRFGLWDLTSFLGTVSLFENPEFDFKEKYVIIKNKNSSKVKYHYSEPSLLTVPTKDVKMPESVVSIDLAEETFGELKKAASVLGLVDLSFCSDGETVNAILSDKNLTGSNTYSIEVGENTTEDTFNFDFKIDNLRFIPGGYKMNIAEKIVSEFVSEDIDLTYWVALESSSSYTKNVSSAVGVS